MTRRAIILSLLTGVSLTAAVGWATGVWNRLWSQGVQRWDDLMAWIQSPVTMDQLMAIGGIILVPVGLLALLFALSDR